VNTYKPLTVLPVDIQRDWMAELHSASEAGAGAYRLVAARRTEGRGFQGQRVTVLVVDENGVALPGVAVAFSYSTADQYLLTSDFKWTPPSPHRAFIARTEGGGMIDQIQGSGVKGGEPGGVTVYILDPEYPSDVVTGAGMLADHTGLHLTFQLLRAGVVPLAEWLARIEGRMAEFDARLAAVEANVYSDQ
jgi:hypothetical protein